MLSFLHNENHKKIWSPYHMWLVEVKTLHTLCTHSLKK